MKITSRFCVALVTVIFFFTVAGSLAVGLSIDNIRRTTVLIGTQHCYTYGQVVQIVAFLIHRLDVHRQPLSLPCSNLVQCRPVYVFRGGCADLFLGICAI